MGENVYIRDLVDFVVTCQLPKGSKDGWNYIKFRNLIKIRDVGLGKLIQNFRQKGVYEESFSNTCCMIGGKLSSSCIPTMVPVQGKDNEDLAGSTRFKTRENLKTSSALEALWKTFAELFFPLVLQNHLMNNQYHTLLEVVLCGNLIRCGVYVFARNRLKPRSGRHLGNVRLIGISDLRTLPSSCIRISSEVCSVCSDSDQNLCIIESNTASNVSVICHQ
ncbi:hypothetical protein Tco_0916149 [Tanacetum coccineum]